ncbi:siderophore-interacting protein [Paludibacterium paludis]|uniref:Siderophore-interacting protein n=1 Tax=Paludibacterium paludis TaxID=1225769 RepID=A0A918NXH9_9NEIS|nr:siderophore-interacting protein [Paludibacterium paludis]GGY04947.1 siderophore-interacting protein [Paludibacterium paludis]
MSPVIHPAVRRVRHPLHFRLLEVRRVTRLSPLMVRVTLGGEALRGFVSESFDDHVKVIFPPPGASVPVMPVPGPDGVAFPEGVERGPMRDYTPRRFDAGALELDIDFVLHGDGPGSTFAATARPGDAIGIAGPKGSFVIPDAFDWQLLVGDATALPAIARRLEESPPGTRIIAFIEVAGPEEEQALVTHDGAEVRWVRQSEEGHSVALLEAVRAFTLPEGEGYVWAAGEFHLIRELRECLVDGKGLPRHCLRAASYWRADEGDDSEDDEA